MTETMIPRKQLEDMGFMEVTPGLFMKPMSQGVKIFRDYRGEHRVSYAYRYNERIPSEIFKELKAIEKIERVLSESVLEAFC